MYNTNMLLTLVTLIKNARTPQDVERHREQLHKTVEHVCTARLEEITEEVEI